jgi:hypothetical protein
MAPGGIGGLGGNAKGLDRSSSYLDVVGGGVGGSARTIGRQVSASGMMVDEGHGEGATIVLRKGVMEKITVRLDRGDVLNSQRNFCFVSGELIHPHESPDGS